MTTRPHWLLGILVASVALIALIVVVIQPQNAGPAATRPPTRSVPPVPTVASAAPPPHSAVASEPPPTLPPQTGRVVFREGDDPTMDESTRRIRREIWQGLEDYAKEAELTEEQWNKFLSTLQESAIEFGYMLNEDGNHRMDHAEFQPTSDELGRDLEEKLAGVLDERQLRLFKFRFHSNLLPAQLARGNILQSADRPDERAWTPSVDGVWPADRL